MRHAIQFDYKTMKWLPMKLSNDFFFHGWLLVNTLNTIWNNSEIFSELFYYVAKPLYVIIAVKACLKDCLWISKYIVLGSPWIFNVTVLSLNCLHSWHFCFDYQVPWEVCKVDQIFDPNTMKKNLLPSACCYC